MKWLIQMGMSIPLPVSGASTVVFSAASSWDLRRSVQKSGRRLKLRKPFTTEAFYRTDLFHQSFTDPLSYLRSGIPAERMGYHQRELSFKFLSVI